MYKWLSEAQESAYKMIPACSIFGVIREKEKFGAQLVSKVQGKGKRKLKKDFWGAEKVLKKGELDNMSS